MSQPDDRELQEIVRDLAPRPATPPDFDALTTRTLAAIDRAQPRGRRLGAGLALAAALAVAAAALAAWGLDLGRGRSSLAIALPATPTPAHPIARVAPAAAQPADDALASDDALPVGDDLAADDALADDDGAPAATDDGDEVAALDDLGLAALPEADDEPRASDTLADTDPTWLDQLDDDELDRVALALDQAG